MVIILVKGINQHVIEVKNTDNIYFERAILIVRPHCSDLGVGLLQQESKKYVDAIKGHSGLRGNRIRRRKLINSKRKIAAFGALCGIVGVIVGAAGLAIVKFIIKLIG